MFLSRALSQLLPEPGLNRSAGASAGGHKVTLLSPRRSLAGVTPFPSKESTKPKDCVDNSGAGHPDGIRLWSSCGFCSHLPLAPGLSLAFVPPSRPTLLSLPAPAQPHLPAGTTQPRDRLHSNTLSPP